MKNQAQIVHVSKSKRQEILQRSSSAVAHYQPKIEQRVSRLAGIPIEIGDVEVKDMQELDRYLREEFLDSTKKIPNPVKRFLAKNVVYPLVVFPASKARRNQAQNDFSAIYHNNGIYHSFEGGLPSDNQIPAIVIEELTHGLWENGLGGKSPFDVVNNPVFDMYYEGFSFFGVTKWFADFLPNDVRKESDTMSSSASAKYRLGRDRIERLVDLKGEQVLLEIPMNWESLHKELLRSRRRQ